MNKTAFGLVLSVILSSCCGIINKTARKELTDGFYNRTSDSTKHLVYVNVVDDTLRIHPAAKTAKKLQKQKGLDIRKQALAGACIRVES